MSTPSSSSKSEGSVRVLARGLTILQAFEPGNSPRSNAELAHLTGIPKPTVSRLTANLTASGYLILQNGEYKLGSAVLALGYFAASTRDIKTAIRPFMQEIANQHQASVVLASHVGMSMVCEEVCHCKNALFTLRISTGSRLNLVHSAVGRAFISSMPDNERASLFAQLKQVHGEHWVPLEAAINAAMQQMRADGYCTTTGTLESSTNGVAVTIDTPDQANAFSLGCALPSYLFPKERLVAEVAPSLLSLKSRLEKSLFEANLSLQHTQRSHASPQN